MIKNVKNFAFGLAVTLGLFLAAEGILWISGVEPLYERTDPHIGFAGHSPLFVENRAPYGEHIFATANNKRDWTIAIPSGLLKQIPVT